MLSCEEILSTEMIHLIDKGKMWHFKCKISYDSGNWNHVWITVQHSCEPPTYGGNRAPLWPNHAITF